MASVTSLDGDLRKLRLEKYTPAAAREARDWIEGVLGERLPGSDLLEGLKDGVALCRLANLATSSSSAVPIRFKRSAMPFVQMENISQFLRACQASPLNLQQHDMFLTVDLYEAKDPAQVLQCLGAFSRAAHRVHPSAFPSAIGPAQSRTRGGSFVSPQSTGSSPSKQPTSPSSTSSWSKRNLEGATAPAWNIAQYGYMGGASQGNLGISFGGRRQITSAGPHVPNALEKERARREEERRQLEEMRQEEQRREEEHKKRREEEEEALRAEERRWAAETERLRREEKERVEAEKRRWEEEERQWQQTEEQRRREEAEAEARLEEDRQRQRSLSQRSKEQPVLHGQFLSQYRAEHDHPESSSKAEDDKSQRIRELEEQLERARQREQEYEKEREREGRQTLKSPSSSDKKARSRSRGAARSRSRPRPAVAATTAEPLRQDSFRPGEREVLSVKVEDVEDEEDLGRHSSLSPQQQQRRPLPDPRVHMAQPPLATVGETAAAPAAPAPASVLSGPTGPASFFQQLNKEEAATTATTPKRPLPETRREVLPETRREVLPETRREAAPLPSRPLPEAAPSLPSRPLPETAPLKQQQQQPPSSPIPKRPLPVPFSSSSAAPKVRPIPFSRPPVERSPERSPERSSTVTTTPKKSLLEREMERERERQREWEEAQKQTAAMPRRAEQVDGVEGRWDVNQWSGYTGGDSQNRGSQGIGAGRRQIVGPRPLPGR